MVEPGSRLPEDGRYEVLRRLGAGGMGVVYEARDVERGTVVALKVLARADAGGIYRFKREFRSLADVSHPNLVALHELVSSGEDWFFTMDLIDGVDFLTWVRHGDSPAGAETVEMTPGSSGSDPTAGGSEPGPRRGVRADEALLHPALRQLCEGVQALHAAGKMHRDLKPSNVMVSSDGHVTLLDFGLVFEQRDADLYRTLDEKVMGTPAYMSPEQAAGRGATPASDWYSVGAMLYEALTGVLPFHGSVVHVMAMKQLRDPADPRHLADDAPEDLAALCMELLRRDPSERPAGDEVLARLDGNRPTTHERRPPTPRDAPPLVGRDADLATLAAALGDTRRGAPVLVELHGPSGFGKTALAQHFLDRLRAEGSTVVLAGRCYERESVPFKALDSVMDALSRYLRRLESSQAAALLPRDVHALERVFPVLRRVKAVATAPEPASPIRDAQELRRRAFAALRELLARIADRHPTVLFVDDLQWADADSAAMISELLRPPDAPALLLVGAWRSEGEGSSPVVTALRELERRIASRDVSLGSLSEQQCTDIAESLLAREGGEGMESLSAAIGREAEGSPFFVGELVRHAVEQHASGDAVSDIRLEEVLRRRLDRLAAGARRLLESVAVAGQPIETTVAVRAAKLDSEAPSSLVALRAGSWVRGHGARGEEVLETYHDRIREAVTADLDERRRRRIHRRLARALIARGDPDAELLAEHLEGAGETEAAGGYAADAGGRAAEALAFDRAVRLYERALSLMPPDAEDRGRIEEALGDALAHDGRSARAADTYLRAAGRAGTDTLELRRKAAEHLLRSGHVERGLELLRTVLTDVGVEMPRTPRGAVLSLVARKAGRSVLGVRFTERPEADVPKDTLRRVDACWSATMGLSMVDPVAGAEAQARHLGQALRAGEPYRVSRALAVEAAHRASLGPRAAQRVGPLLDRAEGIAERIDNPHAIALVRSMRGTRAFLTGRWALSFELCEQADTLFRERCTNVAWEMATNTRFLLVALYYMGALGELTRRVPALVAVARERDDLYARACAGSGCPLAAWLATDDLGTVDDQLTELRAQWTDDRGFQLQHYMLLQAETHADLYRGRGVRAFERMMGRWPAIERSLILRVQVLRVIMHGELASVAVAAGGEERLRRAEAECRRLAKERMPWAKALSTLLRAGLESRRGRVERAAELLSDAAAAMESVDGHLFAAAARRHRGVLIGGDQGRDLVSDADRRLAREGVRDPEAICHMLAPGFRDARA